MAKWYQFNLPVFKQGDDLACQLRNCESPAVALKEQAAKYKLAASLCEELSEVFEAQGASLKIIADCHLIAVEGPKKILEDLESRDLLDSWDDGEDGEDV